MCRHICPIGNVTGQERNNARARALALSLVVRGGEELADGIDDNVYECALCGACTKECATGWDPVKFTKEVRLDMAMNGQLPSYIQKLVENIEKTGNVYGKTEEDKTLAAAISKLPQSADTLFYIGKEARYNCPEAAVKAIGLLEKSGVSFTVLADEPDSGYAMDTLVGAAEDTRALTVSAAEALNKFKTVVCYNPSDAKIMLREYKEWETELTAKVVTFTAFVNSLIKDGSLKVKNSGKTFTFQDPFALARELEETEEAREILSACGKTGEMLLNRKDTMFAGSLIMNEYMPETIKGTAQSRWNNAKAVGLDTLVTASPDEYVMLSLTKPKDMELYTIEEAVLQCL